MKLAGIVFIVASAGWVGFGMAVAIKKQIALYQSAMQALSLLKNEIAFCGTALPQAFGVLATSCDGVLSKVFQSVANSMDRHPWLSPAEAMVQGISCLDDQKLKTVFLRLGQGLGNYGLDAQVQAIHAARDEIGHLLNTAETTRKEKSKVYETMGICAGLSAAILLI